MKNKKKYLQIKNKIFVILKNLNLSSDKKCLYCQKELKISMLSLYGITYCQYCNSKFLYINKEISLNIFKCKSLYVYNEYARDFLYQYKELGDIKLACFFQTIISMQIQNLLERVKYLEIIIIPSNPKSLLKRGFNPVEEIVLCAVKELPYYKKRIKINCNYKRFDDIKQGKLSLKERKKTRNFFSGNAKLIYSNILIIDDVITTGQTITNFLTFLGKQNQWTNIYVLTLFTSENLL